VVSPESKQQETIPAGIRGKARKRVQGSGKHRFAVALGVRSATLKE
jgi:hypothetical protein